MYGIIKTTTAAAILVVGTIAAPALQAQTQGMNGMSDSGTMPPGQGQMMALSDMSGQAGMMNMMQMMMKMMQNMEHDMGGAPNMMGQTSAAEMKNFVGGMTDEQRQLMLKMLKEHGSAIPEDE